jgi:hypothetical protein
MFTEIGPSVAPSGTTVEISVGLEAITSPGTPLNVTVIIDSSEEKFNPMILTIEPTNPNMVVLIIEGDGITVKVAALLIVTPLVVTEIFPVEAPTGTCVVMLVGDDAETVVVTPLNLTTFSIGVAPKFVPVIITSAPTAPLVGLKLVIVGVDKIIKLVALLMVTPLTVTVIFPEVAAFGTITVILVEVEETTTAFTPLNLTTLLAGVGLKFVPVIVIVADTALLIGVISTIVGEANTIKLVVVVRVIPFTVTEIGPVRAPIGTIALILVVVDDIMSATIPLNDTTFSSMGVLKLVPLIVTVAPTAALVGVKPVIVGVASTIKFVAL